MTESTPRPLARKLLRVVLGPADVSDRDLLARFVASRDEDAFAELVRRHGRMVLAVGRRVTGHPQDAEDAFQAAFLVLARRAGQVNRPEQLANWLYGVAYRTALEARAARRRVLEYPVSAAPEPTAPESRGHSAPGSPESDDLRRVIDEELAKLPDKYRSAVVLCDLEGLSRADAATQLKIPEGTLSSRLAYARKVLATRLTRRGIGSTAGAIAVAFGRDALAAPLPRELVLLTARAATRLVGGGAIPPDLVSPSVSSITDGVLKTMLANRLRLTLGAVMLSGLLGLGAYGLAQVPSQNSIPQPDVIRATQPATPAVVATEPVVVYQAQPKPEKVAPKGIEDDDVPFGASPAQAVVRVEEGKLIVRQRSFHYAAVAQDAGGNRVVSYQRRSTVSASSHDPADVSVFDMKGNRLQTKAWKEKLKADVHALVAFDGKVPHPRELGLFKDDTLLIVLPSAAQGVTEMIAPPVTPRAGVTGPYYAPSGNSILPTTTAPALPGVPGVPSTRPTTPQTPRIAPPQPDREELPPLEPSTAR